MMLEKWEKKLTQIMITQWKLCYVKIRSIFQLGDSQARRSKFMQFSTKILDYLRCFSLQEEDTHKKEHTKEEEEEEEELVHWL